MKETTEVFEKEISNKSELSGIEDEPVLLICLNHDKNAPEYNSKENKIRITKIEEYAYHLRHKYEPKKIGLTEENNNNIISSWEKQLPQIYNQQNEQQLQDKIMVAHDYWSEWEIRRSAFKYKLKNLGYIPPAL